MFNPLRARYAIATMFGLAVVVAPQMSIAQIEVSITIAPPPLPVYEQPAIPDDGYIWAPGYWSYGPDGYFWVPGTWVQPPEVGLLWTPGYWGWSDGVFAWNAGYWGPHIGFYGGVNYGFGYVGHGYEGGYWQGNQFFYNRNVNNVTNVTNIRNVYTKTVVNNVTVNNVSYNGGNGGVTARPTSEEQTAAHETHRPPTSIQSQHHQAASANRALLASVNRGKPEIAATPKPGQFAGAGVVKASRTGAPGGAPVAANKPAESRSATPATATNKSMEIRPAAAASTAPRPAAPVHPSELPKPAERAPVNTGNAARDQEYQKQQADLQAKHDQEREALQQKQTQEHEQLAQQKADAAKTAAVEQQHQQQTQQLQQRHSVEQRTLTHAQAPRPQPQQRPPAEERKPTN